MTDSLKAPTSTAYKIVDINDPFKHLFDSRGVPGTFVGHSDVDSPWVPYGENAAIRYLAFDVRQNITANVLWIKKPGVVGTHYHRGRVVMLCLEGSVRYLEYDWVAEQGGFICETPGESHTLVTDHPNGVKLFGWLCGPIDFYDEEGNFAVTSDVYWFMNHYESYCKEQGIAINPQLYI